MSLILQPITLEQANIFIERFHRHHKPLSFHKFSIAVNDGKKIVGVAMVNRPVSRSLDDGLTLEVCRLCTDGCKNACSILYSSCWRATVALGYKRLLTYILSSENGASLKASGFKKYWDTPGKSWNTPSRPRTDKTILTPRECWGKEIEYDVENKFYVEIDKDNDSYYQIPLIVD